MRYLSETAAPCYCCTSRLRSNYRESPSWAGGKALTRLSSDTIWAKLYGQYKFLLCPPEINDAHHTHTRQQILIIWALLLEQELDIFCLMFTNQCIQHTGRLIVSTTRILVAHSIISIIIPYKTVKIIFFLKRPK